MATETKERHETNPRIPTINDIEQMHYSPWRQLTRLASLTLFGWLMDRETKENISIEIGIQHTLYLRNKYPGAKSIYNRRIDHILKGSLRKPTLSEAFDFLDKRHDDGENPFDTEDDMVNAFPNLSYLDASLLTSEWMKRRWGDDLPTPAEKHKAPKCYICDERATDFCFECSRCVCDKHSKEIVIKSDEIMAATSATICPDCTLTPVDDYTIDELLERLNTFLVRRFEIACINKDDHIQEK